jgi:glutaredoxin
MKDTYVLYTSVNVPNCPSCKKTKAMLEEFHIDYQEIIIGVDITKKEFNDQWGDDVKTVPQIVINGQRIGGYDSLKERFGR